MDRREALKVLAGVAGGVMLATGGRWGAKAIADDMAAAVPSPLEKIAERFIKAKVGVENLAPGLDMIIGPGGNITCLGNDTSVLVVDCGVPQRGRDVVSAVKALHDVPVKTLVNTHWHFDHAGGNDSLAAAGFRIIAHENTRKRLSSRQFLAFMKLDLPPSPASAWPTQTFADAITLYNGDDEVVITHLPPAHTDTDAIVHYKKLNVLQTGDVFFNGFFPFIDYSSGGNVEGMIAAGQTILGIVDDQTKIVPGHGMLATKADLQAFVDMLGTVRDRIKPLATGGKTLDEVLAAKPLADLEAKWGKGMFDVPAFTTLVYSIYTYKG